MNESISQYVYLRLYVRDLDSVRAENCWLPLVMLLCSIILGCQFVVKYSKMSIISTSATTAVNYSTACYHARGFDSPLSPLFLLQQLPLTSRWSRTPWSLTRRLLN